ncbi:MAG TPA: CopD family protein [Gallionellaceae bacterium]|nr:CopD family protein [Gallionellaceae bacterium]
MGFIKLLHLWSIVVWVGGMFFAYVVLRPSAAEVLQPPERLKLWNRVFHSFFNWVWTAIFLVLVTGFYMIYLLGGFGHIPMYINWMLLLGSAMMLIFFYVFFKCYAPFKMLVERQDWPAAGAMLATIRKLVAVNTTIGFLTLAVVLIGRG